MILCWVAEKLYNIRQTEKEPQDQEMKWATLSNAIMKFIVSNLHTGRKDWAGG